jgi:hypothetical protein
MALKPERSGGNVTRQTLRSTQKPGLAAPQEEAGITAASMAARPRRPPKLRRSFPPREPEWEALMRDKNRAAFAEDPRRAELERRLLDLGARSPSCSCRIF